MGDEAIYLKVRDDLLRYATVLVGAAEAEDVVSSVVVRVLSKRPLASLEEPKPYLFRAVLNEARSVRRRRPPPLWRDDGVEDRVADPAVLQAVASLPVRQRAAVYLRHWEDMKVDEVARLMGCRPGTVGRYLHLAHRTLRGALT